jgi:purine-binding chemotaxis protein CheW
VSSPLVVSATPAPGETAGRSAGEEAGAPQIDAGDSHGDAGNSREDAGAPRANKLDAFKEQAGKRRAGAATKAEVEDHARLELLTFVIAGEHYAVDIERIVEIVTPRPVTRVPNADRSIGGIISLRGTIVTLVDVRGKLRHPDAGEASADTRVVVIDFHNEMIGFVVDRVLRVVKAEAGEIEPHPVVHATELDESIRGVFRAGGALTILLDLDKLLDHRWI